MMPMPMRDGIGRPFDAPFITTRPATSLRLEPSGIEKLRPANAALCAMVISFATPPGRDTDN
jgi:hypothetical protein